MWVIPFSFWVIFYTWIPPAQIRLNEIRLMAGSIASTPRAMNGVRGALSGAACAEHVGQKNIGKSTFIFVDRIHCMHFWNGSLSVSPPRAAESRRIVPLNASKVVYGVKLAIYDNCTQFAIEIDSRGTGTRGKARQHFSTDPRLPSATLSSVFSAQAALILITNPWNQGQRVRWSWNGE